MPEVQHPYRLSRRFELAGVLARSEHTSLWTARDVDSGNEYSVKRWRTDAPPMIPPLDRELAAHRAIAAHHRNLLDLVQVDEDQRGSKFLVYEPLNGRTLGREQRGWIDTVLLVRGIAAGLEAAHAGGVVHRNLKHSGVFLHTDDAQTLIPKIMHWHFSRAGETDDRPESGKSVGTPNYMSPEHYRGCYLDHKTDTWSLGVIFYECLTGIDAFPGTSPLECGPLVLAGRFREVTDAAPNCPPEVADLVRRCLAVNRAERIDAADLGAAIDQLLHGSGILGEKRDPDKTPVVGIREYNRRWIKG
jgi:serine/threonine-protein kinase